MSHRVFVYGTLRPGQHNYALLSGRTLIEEKATAAGLAMYAHSLASFPYATEMGGATVTGTVCTVADDQWTDVLHRLDLLEGFNAHHPESSHYIRARRPVVTAGGTTRHAWVYLAGPRTPLQHLQRITSGDWLDRSPHTTKGDHSCAASLA